MNEYRFAFVKKKRKKNNSSIKNIIKAMTLRKKTMIAFIIFFEIIIVSFEIMCHFEK